MRKLEKLKRLDVKELWKHEAHDFTPWLEENIKMLSEAVGPLFDQIFTLAQTDIRLSETRDLLLPRFMNGEVAV
jgi:hypothetical protein